MRTYEQLCEIADNGRVVFTPEDLGGLAVSSIAVEGEAIGYGVHVEDDINLMVPDRNGRPVEVEGVTSVRVARIDAGVLSHAGKGRLLLVEAGLAWAYPDPEYAQGNNIWLSAADTTYCIRDDEVKAASVAAKTAKRKANAYSDKRTNQVLGGSGILPVQDDKYVEVMAELSQPATPVVLVPDEHVRRRNTVQDWAEPIKTTLGYGLATTETRHVQELIDSEPQRRSRVIISAIRGLPALTMLAPGAGGMVDEQLLANLVDAVTQD